MFLLVQRSIGLCAIVWVGSMYGAYIICRSNLSPVQCVRLKYLRENLEAVSLGQHTIFIQKYVFKYINGIVLRCLYTATLLCPKNV